MISFRKFSMESIWAQALEWKSKLPEFYPYETSRGYIFVTNCDYSRVHKIARKYSSQGYEVLVNGRAFDIEGRSLDDKCALFFRKRSRTSPS